MSDYWKEVNAIAKEPSGPQRSKILVPTNEALVRKAKTGAQWAWALGGLSIFNLGLAYFRAPIRLGYGLGITEALFEVGRAIASWLGYVALALDIGLVGVVVWLGLQARSFKVWAFASLLGFLVADTGVLVWFAWITGTNRIATMLIHLLAFAFLWDGLKVSKLYQKRKESGDV